MIAGIVIERVKLATFKRHLDEAGYAYTEPPGPGAVVLKVEYERINHLGEVVAKAQKACRN